LTYLGQTTQPARVDTGDVDISAPASSALTSLQPGATVTLATTSTAGCDNIGGHPILLNQGVAVPIVTADTYMVKPYARTVIGWTATGVTLLMTVDGKDAVSGATAYQLDSVLESLGVVTAIDLDGGNSTTFFAQGHVLNKPSRGSEHPVSTGLLVILAS
jgi:exopolysaccharide biosynthesis protein